MRLPQDQPETPGPADAPSGPQRWMTWTLILVAAAASYLLFAGSPAQLFSDQPLQISYSEFRQQVRTDNVSSVVIQAQQIQGELHSPITQTAEGEEVESSNFVTFVPSIGDDELLSLLEQHGVTVEAEPETGIPWLSILINLLPFALLFLLVLPALRRMQTQGRGIFAMGQSKARELEESETQATFEDVAGLTSAKRELQEVIEFLKDPDRFHSLGGEMPKGVLLVGPPGTGKTLLARAVAGEAGVPFFSITGSDFMELFVGVGASRVRDLFKAAKRVAPSIVFIDEIDSIGRRRGAGLGGGHDEREQTLNQMLSELDGFHPNIGVIVMAATNRPHILDPALLRPGRFDRRVTIDAPTKQDRLAILKLHARNKPLADDVDLDEIARSTPGFTGADLENLLNEAALLAARLGRDAIQAEDIEEARDKVVLDWGMSEKLGTLAFGEHGQHVFLGEEIGRPRQYSEATAQQIDQEVRSILDSVYERAQSELAKRREELDKLADALLERETLPGDEVLAILESDGREPSAEPQPVQEA